MQIKLRNFLTAPIVKIPCDPNLYHIEGMWGVKTFINRDIIKTSFKKLLKNGVSYVNRTLGGWDQVALQRFIWPWAKKHSFSHDSYNCKRFSYCHPFPTQRQPDSVGNFVGESQETMNNCLQSPMTRICGVSEQYYQPPLSCQV